MSHNNHVSAKAEVKQQKIFSAQHDSSTKPNGVCMQEKTRYMRCIRSAMHTSLSLSLIFVNVKGVGYFWSMHSAQDGSRARIKILREACDLFLPEAAEMGVLYISVNCFFVSCAVYVNL